MKNPESRSSILQCIGKCIKNFEIDEGTVSLMRALSHIAEKGYEVLEGCMPICIEITTHIFDIYLKAEHQDPCSSESDVLAAIMSCEFWSFICETESDRRKANLSKEYLQIPGSTLPVHINYLI
jgi:hypothetical protein